MREKLKVNVTNLKKVVNGKLNLDDLDLGFKKHIPYARQMVIAESIANSSINDDGYNVNPHNKRLLVHIYVALEMSNYDGATLIKDLTPEKIIETYDLLIESGLIEKIVEESQFGYISFVNMVDEICSSLVQTDELITAMLQMYAMSDKIEDAMEDVNQMLETGNLNNLKLLEKEESDDNGESKDRGTV